LVADVQQNEEEEEEEEELNKMSSDMGSGI